MNKLSHKHLLAPLVVAILVVGGLVASFQRLLAGVAGKYLTADLDPADLSAIVSNHPALSWTLFAIVVIFCIGYGIYSLAKKKLA